MPNKTLCNRLHVLLRRVRHPVTISRTVLICLRSSASSESSCASSSGVTSGPDAGSWRAEGNQ